MSLKFRKESLDPQKAGRGVLCAVCGEYRFGSLEAVLLFDECEDYGVLCPDCATAGPKQAARLAYRHACSLRQESDRQFRIAELVDQVPESAWPAAPTDRPDSNKSAQ